MPCCARKITRKHKKKNVVNLFVPLACRHTPETQSRRIPGRIVLTDVRAHLYILGDVYF